MLDQVTLEASITVNTAADLARLRDEGRTLTTQELKELTTRIKALEDIAKLEDRLRALENQKQPRSADTNQHNNRQSTQQSDQQPRHIIDPPNALGCYSVLCPLIE